MLVAAKIVLLNEYKRFQLNRFIMLIEQKEVENRERESGRNEGAFR